MVRADESLAISTAMPHRCSAPLQYSQSGRSIDKKRCHDCPNGPISSPTKEDFEWLTFDRVLDGRVVENRDPFIVAQARERRLELQSFLNRLTHEALDDVFTPRPERPPPKAAGKPLHAGKADPEDLGAVAVEKRDAGIGDDGSDLVLLRRFEIVVAEDRDDRDLDDGHFARERARFFRMPVVGQIAADHQDVGLFIDLTEQRLQRPRYSVLAVVQIADCGDADDVPG